MYLRRKRHFKMGGMALALVGSVAGAYYYLYARSLYSIEPVDEIFAEEKSPGGGYLAQVVVRNPGAFSSYQTLVMIRLDDRGASPAIVAVCQSLRTMIDLDWASNAVLRVTLPPDCQTDRERPPRGVSVEFHPVR